MNMRPKLKPASVELNDCKRVGPFGQKATRYRHSPEETRTSRSDGSHRSSLNRFVLTDTGRVPEGTASPSGGRPEFRLDAVPSGSEKAENAAGYAARRALPVQKLSLGLIVGRKQNLILPLLD